MLALTQNKPELVASPSTASPARLARLARRPEAGSLLGMVAVFVFFAMSAGAAFV